MHGAAGAFLALSMLVSACGSLEIGTPLVLNGLESLELNQSTRADVLLALGQPRGYGSGVSIEAPDLRDILFYEYMKAEGRTAELEIMAIFLRNDRYDGHLWFASTERIRTGDRASLLGPVEEIEMGYFPDTSPLDAFVRGQTESSEVLAALDAPTGIGGATLPPDHRIQQVWFYEDIEATDITSQPGGFMHMDMRHRILLVFFHNDRFDGFMWYSNAGLLQGKQG